MERNSSLRNQSIYRGTMKDSSSNKVMVRDSWRNISTMGERSVAREDPFPWPPRSYSCSFCKREFRSAQALGGHMNVHRRDRARLLRQSPPRNGDGVETSICKSPLWQHCKIYQLVDNMRIDSDVPPVTIDGRKIPFRDWVLSLGNGSERPTPLDDEGDPSWVRIPDEVQVKYTGDPVDVMVDEIYAELQMKYKDVEYLRDRAILTPLNENVGIINKKVLDRLPGESKIYKSCDTICKGSSTSDSAEVLYPPEYLNSLKFSGLPNHELELKVGAPIMLLRNLNPKKGLCNGTRLIVTRCYSFLLEALIITCNKFGELTYIPRIRMTPADKMLPFVLKRKQFPVSVSYVMNINKSQGQTVKNVGLYLPSPVFSHGQYYVAVSRVTSPKGLRIVCVDEDQKLTGYTKNIVYREIFNDLP